MTNSGRSLTAKQQMVYDYLKLQIREKGYPPSVREICTSVGLSSTSSVHAHLETLERKGYIKRIQSKNRCIEILEQDFYSNPEVASVPILGKITAGLPIFAVENIEEYFPVPLDFVDNDETFMLQIHGDSMIEKGILNGDYALIKKQNTAQNGDVVVALIDDSATLKTFYKEKKHFRLQPANAAYEPIIVDNLQVLGILRGIFRKYN